MEPKKPSLSEITAKIAALHKLAEDLYNNSAEFPAVNRNAKRILASVEMLRINLAAGED